MPFWRDGTVWRRDWYCQTDEDILRAMKRLRQEYGPLVPIMFLSKPEGFPDFPTIMQDQGLQAVLEEQKRYENSSNIR